MISFPAALSPWSRLLSIFPDEIAIALGRIVQRIAAAIEPMHPREWATGDPDGFDGLVNRGTYDRLVAADWLLAEEAPEEFERRAAMHEHLFLNTARSSPAHGLASVVLLDAGPDQLGSPRLAHLALVIVFLRRAERAGARFSWGVLQDESLRCFPGSNEAEIWRLLQARTNATVTEDQVDRWMTRTLEDHQRDEIWIIGGRRVQALVGNLGVSRIRVDDVLEPAARKILVEIRRGTRTRSVALDLPENDACVRLLRDPFQIRVAKLQRLPGKGINSALVFAHGQRRILAKAGDRLFSAAVPNAPQSHPLQIKQHLLNSPGQIVAANVIGRTTFIVCYEENSLRLVQVGRPSYPRAAKYSLEEWVFNWPADDDAGLLFACARPVFPGGELSTLILLDAERNLFRLQSSSESCTVQQIRSEPCTVQQVRSHVLTLSGYSPPACVAINRQRQATELTIFSKHKERRTILHFPAHGNAFLGVSEHSHRFPLVAVECEPNLWRMVLTNESIQDIKVDPAQRVVGVIQQQHYAEALVTLREDNHVLTLKGATWERTLFESADGVAHVSIFPPKSLIAYTTQKGDLAVFSVHLNRDLCRYVGEPNE